MKNTPELRDELVSRIRRHRHLERSAFKDSVEDDGMNGVAFAHLRNIIRSYQDEHDAKQPTNSSRLPGLLRKYWS